MALRLRFACPACEHPVRATVPGPPGRCGACGQVTPLAGEPDRGCAVCGNPERYRQKDFPHWLGLSILAVACAAFLVTNALYHQWWAWAILIGSAVFDGLLYLWVGDVVVCYRCGAQHRGVPSDRVAPFELTIAERYRQERLRRQQLEADSRS